MPQRASQRKFGKSLKLHLAKQKKQKLCMAKFFVDLPDEIICIPYRLGFNPQPQKNILVSHSRINPAPWKYLTYTNPAQGFLPDRLQNTPKIPVFQSRTPKINRYFSCAQSPRRAKNDIFAR